MRIGICYQLALAVVCGSTSDALEIPIFSKLFKPPLGVQPQVPSFLPVFPVAEKKAQLLKTISFTANGKDASENLQRHVLSMVEELEKNCPVSETLLTNPTLEERKFLNGTWFLQYTSPSVIVGESEASADSWKPVNPSEGESNIATLQVNSKGTVSAAGITVDTSNRMVKQIFNVDKATVQNEVELDFGIGRAGGTFRPSPSVPNRALVAFNEASITFNNGFVLNLGWFFDIVATIRNSKDNGWLETTFLDSDLRIGRGNKGTLFILTRDRNAVQP